MENGHHTNWLLAAIGALSTTVVVLWRKYVLKDQELIREKEARILDKDKSIARLQSFERKAKETSDFGRALALKRHRGKSRRRHGRKGN